MSKELAGTSIETNNGATSLFSREMHPDPQLLIPNELPFDELGVVDAVPINMEAHPPNESPVYRNKMHPQSLVSNLHPDLDTHHRLFENSVKLFKDRPCFGSRPIDYTTGKSAGHYESLTYKEVNIRKQNLGSGILHVLNNNPFMDTNLSSHQKILSHQLKYRSYDFHDENISFVLSIFSANRMEWLLTDLACSSYSITNTALYDTLGENVAKHILESTESPIIICSKDKIKMLLKLKQANASSLQNVIAIVSMDPLTDQDNGMVTLGEDLRIAVHDMYLVELLGSINTQNELPPLPQTVYTISFTSGTTGSNPKGAKITQANIASAMSYLATEIPQIKDGRALIYLPLTHIYERGTSAFALTTGYYLGFPRTITANSERGDAFSNLIEDCKIFKPHYFSIVPRLLTKLESVVKSYIAQETDSINAQLINKIIQYKTSRQSVRDAAKGENHLIDNYPGYTYLKKMLGFDNLIWTQTASAPINPATLIYLKASLSIGVSQLYGLTEVTGAFTRGHPYECIPGSCGSTGVSCEVKLVSREEMGYTADEHKGELLIRGPGVFPGYFKNDEETSKVLDSNLGWFSSGDIARIDPNNGRIYIIDRVKNFFKLAQGEYISPEKIENIYLLKNPIIQQLYIHGDSIRHWLVGIVGISHELGIKFLNDECGYNRADMSVAEIFQELNKVENKAIFLKKINQNVSSSINGLEKLHNIHIELNPLTLDRNVVTPTFKIKRGVASKFFASIFNRLYDLERSLVEHSKL